MSDLDALMKEFEETANAGTHADYGWNNSTYISKYIRQVDKLCKCR